MLDLDSRGALLDWGRPKELILPRSVMVGRVEVGRSVMVAVHQDDDERPIASMFLNDFVEDISTGLRGGDRVSLVIADPTDLGVKAIVNHRFWGLLYANELFKSVRKGQQLAGFVKTVREDGKLDLTLAEPGRGAVDTLTERILDRLRVSNGFLPLTDKSPPETIARWFGVSKKQFKQAVGALYRERQVVLEADGIRWVVPRAG